MAKQNIDRGIAHGTVILLVTAGMSSSSLDGSDSLVYSSSSQSCV